MSTNATRVEDAADEGPSTDNPLPPLAPAKHRRTLSVAKRAISAVKPLKQVKHSSVTKVPHIPEFGNYPPAAQHGKFKEWMKRVKAALEFVPDWTEQLKANWFGIICGKHLQDVIAAYKIKPTVASKPFSSLVQKIRKHFESLSDPALDNYAFENCVQEVGESANDYFIRLMSLTQHMGIASKRIDSHFKAHLQDGLFKSTAIQNGWSAAECVAAATRTETYENAKKRVETATAVQVNAVQSNVSHDDSRQQRGGFTQRKQHQRNNFPKNEGGNRQRCPDCGIKEHRNGRCPAIGKQCNRCKRWGHFMRVCPSMDQPNDGSRAEQMHRRDQIDWVGDFEPCSKGYINCEVESIAVRFLIDSGADVNTLSEKDWYEVLGSHLKGKIELEELRWGNGRRTLSAYGSTNALPVEASFVAKIHLSEVDRTMRARFFVVRGATRSLLGRDTALALGVLRLGLSINTCELKPQGLQADGAFPKVPGVAVHFDIDESVPPTKNAYYSVPSAYRRQAAERLETMEAQDIIEDVIEAPRWISGLSLVPKGKDDFRLVINMRGPNRAIRRSFHRLPTIDEMRVKLAGAKMFTKLDIKSAFHHLELDETSRELTTFQTESGMKRFKRLLFGVNCAPEIFQRVMEQILKGIEGVVIFIDDILIYADNHSELHVRTSRVLAALEKNNLTLNKDKCEFEQDEIKFLGHRLSKEGFRIDEGKVEDVQAFHPPKNVTDLRSFLGLASYLSEYIPQFADLVKPMWDVVKKTPFEWTREAENAFRRTKDRIATCTTTLGFFREDARTVLYTDASPHALGAVLAQEEDGEPPRVICYASKTLTSTERGYQQIQREALGIVWGVERFYFYLLGRHFTIRTDARGLKFIFEQERSGEKRALNRAEAWALRLSCYDYSMEWIRGEKNIADPLSRLCESQSNPLREAMVPGEICVLTTDIRSPIGSLTIEMVRQETQIDREMMEIVRALEIDSWASELRPYELVKDELRVIDGVVTRSGAIVVPKRFRRKTLELAHAGHPGQAAMKSILRRRVWWPGMPTDAEKWVEACCGCSLTSRAERPVPMRMSVLPEEQWEKLAIDFNGPHVSLGGKSILVLVDYFSRFVVAKFVRSTDMTSVAPVLAETLDLLGNPRTIRSDNGPPFNGAEWKEFCAARGIEPEKSTPLHPQQNGLVERYMQVVNKIITIAIEDHENCEKALSEAMAAHNAAVQRTTGIAPEILLFGRLRRGKLPLLGKTIVNINDEILRERDTANKMVMKAREDKKRRAVDARIGPGDEVFVKRNLKAKDQTKFAPIRYRVVSGRSGDFTLKGPDGRILNRNIINLKKAPVKETQTILSKLENHGQPQSAQQKVGRIRKEPAYLKDFVHFVEENGKME